MSEPIQPPPGFLSTQVGKHRHFFANLVPSKAAGVVVACGGWEHCAPDYVVERANFPFHAIEFVSQGKGWLALPGRQVPLRRGSLFSYGGVAPHRFGSDPREPLRKYFVDLSGAGAAPLVAGLKAVGVVQVTRVDLVEEWFEQLLEAGAQSGSGAARVSSLLAELIVRHTMESATRSDNDPAATSRATYERCRATLQRDFLTLSSAGELARLNHLDTAYMTRLFQKVGNTSPYQALVRMKMNHAAKRLVASTLPLKEIGTEVGFPDPYHFSRVFKRTFGLSPRAFREGYHRGSRA